MTSINHVMVWISLIENTQQEENAEGKQTFQGYQDQTYALSEINEHQRTYVKVEHHG